MKKYKKLLYIYQDIITKCIFDDVRSEISIRKLINEYQISTSQSRVLLNRLSAIDLIFSLGKSGYDKNSIICKKITANKLEKKIDFMTSTILFMNSEYIIKFSLFEFIEIAAMMDFELNHSFKISEILTILIFMLQKSTLYGKKTLSYDRNENQFEIKINYYKITSRQVICSIEYNIKQEHYSWYI